ncbi:protein OXIDATIVE STRESS 3 LIKE 2-like [Silene latifolia]|uniref:protein OXIDATIVE STRESS 3 LIKE 2-like n=1 Tax=Silene latifolia TaxID=37657 RepID=UPI003D775A21
MLDNNHMIEQPISRGFLHQSNNGGLVFDQCNSCSSSSSIGINSDDDLHRDDDDDVDDEVESKLKISPFNSAIEALEQALSIRRGISNFYNGKSKSFTSLADTSTSSVKDLTKPENAYSRKRKRLLAYGLLYDKGRTSTLKSPRLGISKKSNNASRNTLAFAVAIKNCEGDDSRIPSLSPHSSPIHPPPWRPFSLVDLQHCVVRASALNTNLMGKRTRNDEIS